jgi:hypothetical protein
MLEAVLSAASRRAWWWDFATPAIVPFPQHFVYFARIDLQFLQLSGALPMTQSAQEEISRQRVHIGAFVDREQRRQLVELAKREDRSVSSVIRQALATYVQRKDKP